jgi:glycosyltransferase involved in cell wall biosynthesis
MKLAISCSALRLSGGIERYALDLVDGMRQMGIQPTFFAREFDSRLPECSLVDMERIAVNWLPGKLRDHAFAWRLAARQRKLGVEILIGCNRVRSAQVAICGGTHLGFLNAMARRATIWDRWQTVLERAHYANAGLIVAHSNLMARELREHYRVAERKIRVIYPATRGDRFRPVDSERRRDLRAALGFPDDRIVFAFPSSSHERKGFGLLSRFFAHTDLPVTLAVAGRPIPTGLRNVRYLGYRRDIEAVYQAADYTILASYYEPFGLVGTESVLCGTPVVLASNIGCGEVIHPSAKLEFTAGNLTSLESAIRVAVERSLAGARTISDPAAAVSCPTDTVAHVRALLDAYVKA